MMAFVVTSRGAIASSCAFGGGAGGTLREAGPPPRVGAKLEFRLSGLRLLASLGLAAAMLMSAPAAATELEDWAKGLSEVCLGGSIQVTGFPQGRFTVADYIVGPDPSPKVFRLDFSRHSQAKLILRQGAGPQCDGQILLEVPVGRVFIRGWADFLRVDNRDGRIIQEVRIPAYGEHVVNDIGGLWIEILPFSPAAWRVPGGEAVPSGHPALINQASLGLFGEGSRKLLLTSDRLVLRTRIGLVGEPPEHRLAELTATSNAGHPFSRSGKPSPQEAEHEKALALELDLEAAQARIFNADFRPLRIEPEPEPEAEMRLGALRLLYRRWSASLGLTFHEGRPTAEFEELAMDLTAARYPPAQATGIDQQKIGGLEVEPKLGDGAIWLEPSRISGLAMTARSLQISGAMEVAGSGTVTIDKAESGELSGQMLFDLATLSQATTPPSRGATGAAKNLRLQFHSSPTGNDGSLQGELVKLNVGIFGWTADPTPSEGAGSTLSGRLNEAIFQLALDFQGGVFGFRNSADENCQFEASLLRGTAPATYTTTNGDFRIPQDGLHVELAQLHSTCPLPSWLSPGPGPEPPIPNPGNGGADCPGFEGCSSTFATPILKAVCLRHEGDEGCTRLTSEPKLFHWKTENDRHGERARLEIPAIEVPFASPLSLRIGKTHLDRVAGMKIGQIVADVSRSGDLRWKATAGKVELSAGGIRSELFPKLEGELKSTVSIGEIGGNLEFDSQHGTAVLVLEDLRKTNFQLDGNFETPDGMSLASPAIVVSEVDFGESGGQNGRITLADAQAGNALFKSLSLYLAADGKADSIGTFVLDHLAFSTQVELDGKEFIKGRKCPMMPAQVGVSTTGSGTLKIRRGQSAFEPEMTTISLETSDWQCFLGDKATGIRWADIFRFLRKKETRIAIAHRLMIPGLHASFSGPHLAMQPNATGISFCRKGLELVRAAELSTPGQPTAEIIGIEKVDDQFEKGRLEKINEEFKKSLRIATSKQMSVPSLLTLASNSILFQDCH